MCLNGACLATRNAVSVTGCDTIPKKGILQSDAVYDVFSVMILGNVAERDGEDMCDKNA